MPLPEINSISDLDISPDTKRRLDDVARRLKALNHALQWCDDHADVRDGGEDGPRPNAAMQLQMELEAIIEGRQ